MLERMHNKSTAAAGGVLEQRWAALVAAIDSDTAGSEPDFDRLADCLMAAGLASLSARCRAWGLLPPPESQWRIAIEHWTELIRQTSIDTQPEPAGLETTQAELNRIDALASAGSLQEACDRLGQLAYQQGLPPHLCNRMGMLLHQMGDYWQAERWYRTSLKGQDGQMNAWFGLAVTLLAQQAADEALEAAQLGLQLQPCHPWGLKLQQRSLTELRAAHSLELLNLTQQLPFPLDLELIESWKQHSDWPSITFSLSERLAWGHALHNSTSHVWLIGIDSAAGLNQLISEKILGESLVVKCFGCRDFERFRTELKAPACALESFSAFYHLSLQASFPDLAIIGPSGTNRCPRALAGLINESKAFLLAHNTMLFNPAARNELLSLPGWTLWSDQ
jgi:tetratricopeptide (TPR) repeat protein